MKFPHTGRELLHLLGSLVFVVGGIAMAVDGKKGGWVVAGFFGLCAAIIGVAPFFPRRAHGNVSVEISDWGVRRTVGSETREAVSWEELSQVSVATTSEGPAVEDVFFLLHGSAGKGVVVAHSIAVEKRLLEQLQERLPGFDNVALVEAMGSTSDKLFVVWRAPGNRDATATAPPKTDSG